MKKSVRDIDVKGKRALVRVDFNVPFDRNGGIADDSRIRAAIPTIDYLRENGASVILATHLGRPDGKVVENLRLKPIAERLASLLGTYFVLVIGIPMGIALYTLEATLIAGLQAFIFATLSAIYIGSAIEPQH